MDYRGVNEFVWEAYVRVYGGGPILARKDSDIYSAQVKTKLESKDLDMNYYINFEKTNEELINQLLKKQKDMKKENKVGKL